MFIIAPDRKLEESNVPVSYTFDDGVRTLLLNLRETKIVNSIGISILIEIIEKMIDKDGKIAFCCLTPVIHKTFQIMGLANYATIFDNEEAAVVHVLSEKARVLLIAGVIFLLFVIGNVISFLGSRNRLPNDTYFGGLNVSGLGVDEAISRTARSNSPLMASARARSACASMRITFFASLRIMFVRAACCVLRAASHVARWARISG